MATDSCSGSRNRCVSKLTGHRRIRRQDPQRDEAKRSAGRFLRSMREALGMTQGQVADVIGAIEAEKAGAYA